MAAKKKSAGGSLTRSQVVTVRLDPRLKYAAELAARKQRRTISSFIEWAVEQVVKKVSLDLHQNKDNLVTIPDVVTQTWDVLEPDRFLNLVLNFPELLSFEEEQLWKIISECDRYWYGGLSKISELPSSVNKNDFICLKALREDWKKIHDTKDGKFPLVALQEVFGPYPPPHLLKIFKESGISFLSSILKEENYDS